jgi:acyl carrier protein
MDTMSDILERLNQAFQYVFEDDEICITRATTAEDVQDWDSVKHVTLMVTVEKTFGIIFTSSQVAGLKNVGELVDLVEAKLRR